MSAYASRISVAVRRVPLLHVQRAGELRTVREVEVDVEVDLTAGDVAIDAARLRAAVHALAPSAVMQEPEHLAVIIARHIEQRVEGVDRVGVDVALARWSRLEIGGRPRTGDFSRQDADQRTAHATITDGVATVKAGIRGMRLLSAPAAESTPLLVQVDARWTYGWGDVPFDTQWQQVRRAIVEAYAERATKPGPALAHALASAVLDESPPVRSIELRLSLRTFEPLDLTGYGIEPAPELVSAPVAGTAVYSAAIRREEMQEPS